MSMFCGASANIAPSRAADARVLKLQNVVKGVTKNVGYQICMLVCQHGSVKSCKIEIVAAEHDQGCHKGL